MIAEVEAEVRLHVRNHALKKRRLELGLTQVELARRIKMFATAYSAIENLKRWPGAACRDVIADVLGSAEEDIFPPELERVCSPITFSRQEVIRQDAIEAFYEKNAVLLLPPAPDDVLMTMDIERMKEGLDPKDREVLERYNDGETLDEIGNILGVSRERVRQRRLRAIQHMQRSARKIEYA